MCIYETDSNRRIMKGFIRKIALFSTVVVALASCRSHNVEISGRFVGLNFDTVYLEQTTATGQNLVDSIKLDNEGCYRFVVADVEPTPEL